LDSTEYGFGTPGVTRVIVAGQDVGTKRKIIEVTTPASLAAEALWGRTERFLDQRNTNDTGELTQAGLDLLATEGAEITSLKVVPSSDMTAGFGSQWWLGSLVTVVVGGQEVKAPIAEVPISIGPHGVFVGATVGDATGFDWESVMIASQSRTERRVSALERSSEQAASVPLTSWVPTLTGITLGNGTLNCSYYVAGGVCYWRFGLSYGSTTTMPASGAVTFTKPPPTPAWTNALSDGIFFAGAIRYLVHAILGSSVFTLTGKRDTNVSAQLQSEQSPTASIPSGQAAGAYIVVTGFYPVE
jgi:hypothetical protein